jgi:hypothetical protein
MEKSFSYKCESYSAGQTILTSKKATHLLHSNSHALCPFSSVYFPYFLDANFDFFLNFSSLIFRRFLIAIKRAYFVFHVRSSAHMSVYSHVAGRFPPEGFSWYLIRDMTENLSRNSKLFQTDKKLGTVRQDVSIFLPFPVE